MTHFLTHATETAIYCLIAAGIGRRTMRANWKRMYRMHGTVLERMQHIEKLIVVNAIGNKAKSRHADRTEIIHRIAPTMQLPRADRTVQLPKVEQLDVLLCRESEAPTQPRAPRRARNPRQMVHGHSQRAAIALISVGILAGLAINLIPSK